MLRDVDICLALYDVAVVEFREKLRVLPGNRNDSPADLEHAAHGFERGLLGPEHTRESEKEQVTEAAPLERRFAEAE